MALITRIANGLEATYQREMLEVETKLRAFGRHLVAEDLWSDATQPLRRSTRTSKRQRNQRRQHWPQRPSTSRPASAQPLKPTG